MFCLCKTELILKRYVQKQFGHADHFTQKLHTLQHFAASHHNPFSYEVVELNPAERGLRLSIKTHIELRVLFCHLSSNISL